MQRSWEIKWLAASQLGKVRMHSSRVHAQPMTCKNPTSDVQRWAERAGMSGGRRNGESRLRPLIGGARPATRVEALGSILCLRSSLPPSAQWLERDWLSGACMQKTVAGCIFCSVSSESGMNFSRALHKSDTGASSLDTPAALKCMRVSAGASDPPRALLQKLSSNICAEKLWARRASLTSWGVKQTLIAHKIRCRACDVLKKMFMQPSRFF